MMSSCCELMRCTFDNCLAANKCMSPISHGINLKNKIETEFNKSEKYLVTEYFRDHCSTLSEIILLKKSRPEKKLFLQLPLRNLTEYLS